MKEKILITDPDHLIRLRTIEESDIELLRSFKNNNKGAFFYKGDITPENQMEWFKRYLKEKKNYMFMIELIRWSERPFHGFDHISIGCIGIREFIGRFDLYNLIIDEGHRRKGLMTRALKLLIEEFKKRYKNAEFAAMVLKSNKALEWYLKNGFVIEETMDIFHHLKLE